MKNSKFMKIIGKKSTGIIITILTLVITFGAIFTISNLTLAQDSLPGIEEIRNGIKGTDGAYTVLEIVPDLEVSEFGYLVGGQEPLDVSTLYDSNTKDWITWQEYLTKNTENMTTADRTSYLNKLVAENSDYISIGAPAADKPMWYQTYIEAGVTAETPGAQVFYGGNTPVYGWLISDDLRGNGWNAKFTRLSFSETYDNLVASKTPYYVLDASKADAQVTITEDDIKNDKYPSHYYTYKRDVSDKYFEPAVTIGELKAMCEADSSWYSKLSEYYVLKLKVLESTDYTANAGPVVYEASDFVYLDMDAPYVIPTQTGKGHNLVKPSNNIYYTGGLYNNELFKQHTLDIDNAELADYNVEVLTVTAGEINVMSREELSALLDTTNLIYLNAGDSTKGYVYVYNDATLDLDNDAVELMFEEICNEKLPCIVDTNLKEQGETNTAITNTRAYALTCMLLQKEYRKILSDGEFDVSKISIGSSSVKEWKNNADTRNFSNFVNGNVMVINSTLSGYGLAENYYNTPYAEDVVSVAYKSVLDELNLENLYRAADQTSEYEPLSTDIYKATAVRYIINYISARVIEAKTEVNVLEIQPANVKYSDNTEGDGAVSDKELDIDRIRTWLNVGESVKVNIDTMNTIEFIGTIEDLNSEYDMIYIGADVFGMQQRHSSSQDIQIPNYYDDDMDYLIYSNIGGRTEVKAQFAGHLQTDFVEGKTNTVKNKVMARYNGNDITADKHNALVDYVKGTYPVVVADRLCANQTEPEGKYVDNCTYLYSFLEKHLSKDNVFLASEVEDGKNTKFKFYANRGKLNIGEKVITSEETDVKGGTAFVQPGTYKTENDTTEKNVTYISKENGSYYLKYKFTITNNGAVYDNTRYIASLYLDSNSDGKFSVEYEKIPDITLTHVASGKMVTNGELVAGEQYILTREVPATYSGILTWKVEVCQTSNEFIRDNIVGYTRLAETKKVVIKVLQIRRDGGSPLVLEDAIGNTKYKSGSKTEYAGNNDTLRKLVWGGKCDADGVTYEGITKDFEFQFTTLTNAQLNDKYKNRATNGFKLDDYDMLVLGFYDSYDLRGKEESDIDYDVVNGKGGIREFIDSGKSILFAHDTTSVTAVNNYESYWVDGGSNIYCGDYGANVWGYNLNMYIRDMVGLDTYGITMPDTDDVKYSLIKSGKDLSTSDDGKKVMEALKNELDAEGYYKIGLKPLAYLPKSDKKQTVGETQGFVYGWMDWHWRGEDTVTYRSIRSKYNTDIAQRVNEGQITTYPYYLDETIDITRTHHQYYTLDLNSDDDKDGETDLVVWYTMGGKEGDESHMDSEFDSNDDKFSMTKESNMDDTSEKDVMSNYYIYNKGNITYTGFGDFDSDYWRNKATIVEECKLFVNTLVAAYNASAKDPQITVYESEENMVPTTRFYEYGDVDNEIAFRENTQRMYFSIADMNVLRGKKTAKAEYYVALKPGMIDKGTKTYKVDGVTYTVLEEENGTQYIRLDNLKTYSRADGEVKADELECGNVYYVDIPTTAFDIKGVDGQNVNTFMVEATVTLDMYGSLSGTIVNTKKVSSYTKVDFVHVELFPLD